MLLTPLSLIASEIEHRFPFVFKNKTWLVSDRELLVVIENSGSHVRTGFSLTHLLTISRPLGVRIYIFLGLTEKRK